MDEFADLERELSRNVIKRGFHDLEDLVIEIEEEASKSNTIFRRVEEEWSPKKKTIALIFGVIFTPLFGLGLLLIWSVIRFGAIDQHTSSIRGRGYLKRLHAIVNYEIENNHIRSVKVTQITENAFIKKSKEYYGSSGAWRWDYILINGRRNNINLLSSNDINSREHVVPDFAKRTKLEIKEYFPYSLKNQLKDIFGLLAFIFVAFVVAIGLAIMLA